MELQTAIDMSDAIDRQIDADPRLASPHTRRMYRAAVRRFEAWREGRPFVLSLLTTYAVHLRRQGLAPATINFHLATTKWWARRIVALAEESPELSPERKRQIVTQGLRAASVRGVRASRTPTGRHVDDDEIRALLEACSADWSPAGKRDAAMVAVLFASGLRRAELCALQLGDVAPIEGGYNLTVRHGKGDKTRNVAVFGGARAWLSEWMERRGDAEGPLFLAVGRGGHVSRKGLGPASFYRRLQKRAAEAGVPHVSPHDGRRTCAGNLLDAGADLATTQKILGHADAGTTAMYDRRPEETRRRALRAVNVWRPANKRP